MYGVLDVFGPTVTCLTSLSVAETAYGVMMGTMHPGVSGPLHIACGGRPTITIGSADRHTTLQSVFSLLHDAYTQQHQHVRLRVKDPLPRC